MKLRGARSLIRQMSKETHDLRHLLLRTLIELFFLLLFVLAAHCFLRMVILIERWLPAGEGPDDVKSYFEKLQPIRVIVTSMDVVTSLLMIYVTILNAIKFASSVWKRNFRHDRPR